MLFMSMYFIISMTITTLLLVLPLILKMMYKSSQQKNSTFECGMNLTSSSRKPFSLRFFLLMVLFIIFDVEITLLLAMPMITPYNHLSMNMVMIFITVLTMGTLYEWSEGSLNWKS